MRFQVITIFPEMIEQAVSFGVVAQAHKEQRLSIEALSPREFTANFHKTVDDRPFGGGDGMVMLAEPLLLAVQALKTEKNAKVIFLSAHGTPWTDQKARALAQEEHLILVCGRYGGVDQRFINAAVDEEISLGDFVLTGGELAALAVIDSVSRFLPGVLGNALSNQDESFAREGLLEAPQFTRPREWQGLETPAVLMSGNHAEIARWRFLLSIIKTAQLRQDLLRGANLDRKDLLSAAKLLRQMPEAEKNVCGITEAETVLRTLELGQQ